MPVPARGRGLALVAAGSGGWVATPTLSGKAVCCEFAVRTDDHLRRFGHRVARASELIESYGFSPQVPLAHSPTGHAVPDAVAVTLITDLLHWLAANGRDPDTVLDQAQTHFEAETDALHSDVPSVMVSSLADSVGAR
ncbi:hypothetical protein [Streptomyces sp. NBC_01198]|uniref:hypothetical protein n=1 Tax=Streptomyces sp. NBC_01198 TaxID=2903769 RepID=UPI002E15B2D9|nr:hypothetical protein OG702_21075 [Streptomyces sp. NBC_01198]